MKILTSEQVKQGWTKSLSDQLTSASVSLCDTAILYETICSACNCHSNDCPAKHSPNGPNGLTNPQGNGKEKQKTPSSNQKRDDSDNEDIPGLDPPSDTAYAS
ncbi:hypothetical protein VKT23_014768 [Stygiomarasmius scandens]|uniref:Uncharacterized protein n=1 Tax=Marasmiellus scandens TaxID=2682957 RepID=A0ABR1J4C4_9AGAR